MTFPPMRGFDIPELTGRTRDIVMLLGYGLHTKEIANRLGIAESSTKTMIFNVSQKTGLSRLELAILGERMREAMCS